MFDKVITDSKQEVDTELCGGQKEMVKQEVQLICVLCGQEGHMGKDCEEVVCILCCSKGHLMDECRDIVIVDDVEGEEGVEKRQETTSVSPGQETPTIRLKSLNDLLESKDDKRSVSLEEIVVPVASTKNDGDEYKSDEEEKFHKFMIRKFSSITPPDVITLFKQKYCGLCCTKFSCEKFAWKHYNGRGHESLIKKKTFRNRPLFWQMVFHALISVEPNGATKNEIFRYILHTFSAHLNDNPKQVRAEMDTTIKDMVERFHNVVHVDGVYRLRDRKPNEGPKPVPDGLVEKSKYNGSFVNEKKPEVKFGFSNFERYASEKFGKNGSDASRPGKRELELNDDRDIDLRGHSRSVLDHTRRSERNGALDRTGEDREKKSSRREREDRNVKSSRSPKDRSSSRHRTRDHGSSRVRTKDRSRSRDRSYRKTDNRKSSNRVRSRSRQKNRSGSKVSTTYKISASMRPASLTPELPLVFGSDSPAFSSAMVSGFPSFENQTFPTPMMAGYPSFSYPTYMSHPGIAETLSSLFSGYLMAPQGLPALLTPPPTEGDLGV